MTFPEAWSVPDLICLLPEYLGIVLVFISKPLPILPPTAKLHGRDHAVMKPVVQDGWQRMKAEAFDQEYRPGEPGDIARMEGTTSDSADCKRGELLLNEQQQLLECIARGCPLDECLNALTDAVSRLEPNIRAAVLLANEDCSAVAECHSTSLQPAFGAAIAGALINDLTIGTSGTTVFTGESVTCSDIAGTEWSPQPWRDLCLAHGIRACRSTPVFGPERKVVAWLVLCFSEAHEPDAWEQRIAESCTHIAGIALERHRVEKELRESREQLADELAATRQLQAVSTELIQEDNTEALYGRILDAAVSIMRADYASLQMFCPERGGAGELRLLYVQGFNPEATRFWEWVGPTSHSVSGVALRTGHQCIVPDVEQCEFMADTEDLTIYLQAGIHAVQTTPLLSRSGRLVGMISTHWKHAHRPPEQDLRLFDVLARQAADLIERKQADDALRKSKERFDIVSDASEVGYWFCDLPFDELIWDNRAKEHFWLPPDADVTIRLFYERLHPDDRERTRQSIEASIATNARYDVEYRTVSPEGKERWIRAVGRAFYDENKKPVRFDGLTLDISRRKRDEEALRKLNDELEQRVAARTYELAQSEDRLRTLATELNLAEQRERKRLATELHDHLQQTLVLGKLTIGQGRRAAAGVPAYEQVLKKVDDIFSDALSYTRTLVSDLSPTVLRDHGLAAALQWLGTYMWKHDQLVTVTVPNDEEVKLPEDQVILLFQSVRELLINSAKHAGTGEATVRMEQRDGQVWIEVRDEGVGFDLASVSGTPHDSLSSKFGLFSIRERMRALGGSFELESNPGKGTRATLTLLVRGSAELSGAAADVRAEHPALKTHHSELRKHAPIRALLVDNHVMVRQGLRVVLDAYDDIELVGEAGNGEEAVQLVDQHRPALVLMDINMPKKNGIEATREIKTRYPDTIVIGLSVNVGGENQAQMLEAGAATLLTKEAAVEQLHDTIQAAVRE